MTTPLPKVRGMIGPSWGSLRRMLVRLQRLIAPEPAALFRLLSRPPYWIHEREL